MIKYALLDTNVILHYRIEDINWREIMDSAEVEIVVCPTVMRELDHFKDNDRGRKGNHARTMCPKLMQLHRCSGYLRENVKVKIYAKSTFIDWEKEGLDKGIKDDQIIAFIIENKDKNIVFVSTDNTALVKAEERGILTYELDEQFKLPEEKSDEEKELERLRQWKAGLPNISIRLVNKRGEGKDKKTTFIVSAVQVMTDSDIEEYVKKEAQELDIIKEENEKKIKNEVEIWYKKIRHNSLVEGDDFYIMLDSLDIEGFEMKYNIYLENLPDPISGKIPVKIEKVIH